MLKIEINDLIIIMLTLLRVKITIQMMDLEPLNWESRERFKMFQVDWATLSFDEIDFKTKK